MRISEWSSDVCVTDLNARLDRSRNGEQNENILRYSSSSVSSALPATPRKGKIMFYILASLTFAAAFVAAMTNITVMLQQYWHKLISALLFGSQGVSIAHR